MCISQSVGLNAPDQNDDVTLIQALLNLNLSLLPGVPFLLEDGVLGPHSQSVIQQFQTTMNSKLGDSQQWNHSNGLQARRAQCRNKSDSSGFGRIFVNFQKNQSSVGVAIRHFDRTTASPFAAGGSAQRAACCSEAAMGQREPETGYSRDYWHWTGRTVAETPHFSLFGLRPKKEIVEKEKKRREAEGISVEIIGEDD
jgi:hypothetical protein